jgi:hypothetical protein
MFNCLFLGDFSNHTDWQKIKQSPLDENQKKMWFFGQICIKQGCKHAKQHQKIQVPQVYLHQTQLSRLIEVRYTAESVPFRLVTEDHIGHVVVCVDHFPKDTQNILFNMMLSGTFNWNLLSEEQLASAQICIGYGKESHLKLHSTWKNPCSRMPKMQWRYTPVNKKALLRTNFVVKHFNPSIV